MRLDLLLQKNRRNHRAWLYSIVFAGKISVMAVMLLLFSFLVQPIHQAMANEASAEVAPLPTAVNEDVSEANDDIPLPIDIPMSEEDVTTDISSESISTTASLDSPLPDESEEVIPSEVTSAAVDDQNLNIEQATSTEVDLDTVSSTTETEGASSTVLENTSTGEVDQENATDSVTSSSSTNENDVVEEYASSTDGYLGSTAIEDGVTNLVDSVVHDVVTLTRQMVTEENYYQFSKQSCVAVGDGAFHCTDKERTMVDDSTDTYADRDEVGDMEIYLKTGSGDTKQLSKNDYDDTSPDLDMTSSRVVWQRLIDGRYQIISYDLDEGEEQQLTFSRTNSMEPKVAKEGIVWQAWDGNDWEIIFFDGRFTNQITDNDIQDVTPVIEDGYILWSVLGGESSEARVYSIESGETMTITGHEGGAVANPRFVLVYDTKFDNGDVITQGFDPITGLASPIAAKPVELPFNIPEPDPVGEIVALINTKSTQKDKDIVTTAVTDGGNDLNLASTTASSSDTLNLSEQNNSVDTNISSALTVEPSFELTEFDLVITREASSTNSVLNEIFYETTTTVSAQP